MVKPKDPKTKSKSKSKAIEMRNSRATKNPAYRPPLMVSSTIFSMDTPCSQPSINNEPPLEAPPNSLMESIVNETLDSGFGGVFYCK